MSRGSRSGLQDFSSAKHQNCACMSALSMIHYYNTCFDLLDCRWSQSAMHLAKACYYVGCSNTIDCDPYNAICVGQAKNPGPNNNTVVFLSIFI